MITYTYEFKIKPTKQQIRQFEQYLDICRSVYNYAHAERKTWLESRKSRINSCSIISEYIIPADVPYPNYKNQAKALTEAKNKFPHLKLVNAQALQQVLKRLDQAWEDFFKVIHSCSYCHHSESRDTNSAKIIMQRGLVAVGHTVNQNACGYGLSGFKQIKLLELDKSLKQEFPVTARL